MLELIKLVNPTEAQCNILLPRRNIDIKLSPKSESKPLSAEVLPLIHHYITAFNLTVLKVVPEKAVEDKPEEVQVDKSQVEALTNLVDDQPTAPAQSPEQKPENPPEPPPVPEVKQPEQPPADKAEEPKKYTEAELHGLSKGDVVKLAESLGVNAEGNKGDVIGKILAFQG